MASLPTLVAAVLVLSAAPAAAQSVAASTSPAPAPARATAGTDATRVEITTEDKKLLVGSFFAPKDTKGAAPAALLVHDAGGCRADLDEIAERLQKQGFAVLSIDLRFHGESVGKDKPWAELSPEEQTRNWTYAPRDVKAGIAWLSKQPGVHSSNVSLLGDRAGCTLVTRHAVRDEDVRSLVLLDPQSEQLGFNLAKDVQSLAGLPTFIAVTKEAQPKAETIAQSGEKANDGMKYIEIAVFKGVAVSPVFDKRLPTDIAKFMASKAQPKKTDK